MDYEKAYKDALERAKSFELPEYKNIMASIFPELRETEDERIRKEFCEDIWTFIPNEKAHKYIAWLEKQSGQKPFDYENANIQQNDFAPKFKLGDWIVWKDKCYKVNDNGCGYELIDTNGLSTSLEYGTIDENARLWTIADAKDGDVLSAHECIVVFKEIDGLNIKCHCTYHYMNNPSFHVDTLQNKTAFHPATNNQRELLFAEMHEAGYEWNAEKKELRKIEKQGEQKDINPTLIEKEKMDNAFTKMMLKGKTKWTQVDNSMLDTIEGWLNTLCGYLKDSSSRYIPNVEFCINWLKSLKQRMEEQQ